MSLFDLVRSVLGLDESSDSKTTEAPIDHGTSEAKDVEEAAAAGTDATASTNSMTQTPSSDPETAAEPAEAGAGVTEHSGTETPAAESAEAAGPVPNEEPDPADTAAASADEAVDAIDGIGPAYGERLADAGVETVADLLAADAEELADETDISETRISRWQDQAAE